MDLDDFDMTQAFIDPVDPEVTTEALEELHKSLFTSPLTEPTPTKKKSRSEAPRASSTTKPKKETCILEEDLSPDSEILQEAHNAIAEEISVALPPLDTSKLLHLSHEESVERFKDQEAVILNYNLVSYATLLQAMSNGSMPVSISDFIKLTSAIEKTLVTRRKLLKDAPAPKQTQQSNFSQSVYRETLVV